MPKNFSFGMKEIGFSRAAICELPTLEVHHV